MFTLWSSQIPFLRMISYFFPSRWRPAFFAAVDRNFPTCCILFFPRGAFTYQTSSFERRLCRRPPSKIAILVGSFQLANDCGIFCKNWQDISLYWWHKPLVGTLFAWCPLSWLRRVFVPSSAKETKTSWPPFCGWSWTLPLLNLQISSQLFKGIFSSSLSMAWTACGLFPVCFPLVKWLSLRCKD